MQLADWGWPVQIGLTTFGADGGKSGISRYLISLLSEFAQMAEMPPLDVITYEHERQVFIPPQAPFTVQDISASWQRAIVNILWHQTVLPGMCRKGGYDVLFLPAANRRVAWSAPCPVVGTVHDFSSIHVAGKYDPARMFYITRVLPMLVRRLSHVLTVSESSKRDIVEYAGVAPERVTVTPLAADTTRYTPGDPDEALRGMQARYRFTGPYILYVARLEHPGKNHVRLIQAFELLKQREHIPHALVLAGTDWDRAEEVHQAATRSAFSSDIVFTGFVAEPELPVMYGGTECFVFPSLYEGFGLPVLEAMCCGAPVACANVSSIPEVAGDAALLFDPYEVDAIAGAMMTMIADASMRERYSLLGLARGRQFSWRSTAEKTLSVLQLAASEGRR